MGDHRRYERPLEGMLDHRRIQETIEGYRISSKTMGHYRRRPQGSLGATGDYGRSQETTGGYRGPKRPWETTGDQSIKLF